MTTTSGELPAVFVTHAADIFGDTSKGLSGPQIVKLTAAYAVDWNVTIRNATYPFTKLGINKRTALAENLLPFNPAQRYRIIRDLCDMPPFRRKVVLFTRYGHFDDRASPSDLNMSLVEDTKHWLDAFGDSKQLFEAALQKHEHADISEYIEGFYPRYRTRDEARADIFEYVERFYNSKRRHSTLGQVSPAELSGNSQPSALTRLSGKPSELQLSRAHNATYRRLALPQ